MSKNRNSIWRSAMGFAIALPILQIAALPAFGQERGPLTLAKSSYFFVGGGIDTSLEGSPMVGQMYVEYMIPQRQRHPYPVVMVHGGGQTGTNFTGTPDGREGWAQYFVRRGYAVYVVDQVARGRAAYWDQAFGALPPAPGNCVCRRACGHFGSCSGATKRCSTKESRAGGSAPKAWSQ